MLERMNQTAIDLYRTAPGKMVRNRKAVRKEVIGISLSTSITKTLLRPEHFKEQGDTGDGQNNLIGHRRVPDSGFRRGP